MNGVGVKNIVSTYSFNSNNGLSGQTRSVSGDTSSVMSAITASNSDRPLSARIWNKQKQVFEDQNYSYDASGNLVSISATSSAGSYAMTFNWNSQGQLVSMTNSNPALSLYPDAGVVSGIASASYYYDANGARVKKVTKDANGALMLSTGFLYSDHDATKVLVEYTLNYEANRVPSSYGNFSSKEYVYLPNPQTGVLTPAAMLKQSNAGLEVFYLMPDQLGSVQTVVQARNVVDATGQAVNNTAFVAYSTALGDSKVFYRDDFSKNGGFNLRAPGQYLDIETGLLYNNARYFNPWIGAFISADPIGKNGGTNVYAYGVGSLINDVDDSGLDRWGAEGGLAIIYTQQKLNRTIYYDAFSGEYFEFETRSKVDSSSAPGADGPYSGLVLYCQRDVYNEKKDEHSLGKAYGTAKVINTDKRSRWIHGGGSKLETPYAPRQGWKPTMGCTRAQNEDVDTVCDKIDKFHELYPHGKLLYRRD